MSVEAKHLAADHLLERQQRFNTVRCFAPYGYLWKDGMLAIAHTLPTAKRIKIDVVD